MKGRLAAVAATILAAGAAVACAAAVHTGTVPPATPAPPASSAAPAVHTGVRAGIVTSGLAGFDDRCQCRPGLIVRYIRWGETAQAAGLSHDLQLGAEPLAELQPYGVTLSQISGGSQDAYLAGFARQVAALRVPVLMSFAPEVNNDSYPWGYRHSSPEAFTAAWRHVVTVFRAAGAVNVRWVLVLNYSSSHTEPIASLWPGRAYVDIAGIDGYATTPEVTFRSLFGATVAEVRALGNMPVMITETGASPTAGKTRWMGEVTAGIKADHLTGFVWFNVNQKTPRGGHDWSLDDDPAALAAFRAAVRWYG